MVRRLAVAGFACCLIAASPGQPIEDRGGRGEETREHRENPAEHAEVVTRMPRAAASLEAENDHADSGQNREYMRRELYAQEETAFWTRWMAYAAFMALFLSTVGVILIYKTFAITRAQTRTAFREFGRARLQARRAAKDAEDTVAQAARSADAMENVAGSMAVNAAQIVESVRISKRIADAQQSFAVLQMRAYVTVVVGSAIFQDRNRNLRFEAKPQIINSGSTAAKDLSYWIKAEILPYPPPEGHVFEEAPESGNGGFIPPHQDRLLAAVVPNYISDELVPKVMFRDGLGLYVWGKISYRDEFGEDRETNFGQSIFWMFDKDGNQSIMAEYIPGMNGAT